MGGVKWVSNPHVVGCSYPPKEGCSPTVEEQHHTLKRTKPESTANAQGRAPPKKGVTHEPPKSQAITLDSPKM